MRGIDIDAGELPQRMHLCDELFAAVVVDDEHAAILRGQCEDVLPALIFFSEQDEVVDDRTERFLQLQVLVRPLETRIEPDERIGLEILARRSASDDRAAHDGDDENYGEGLFIGVVE